MSEFDCVRSISIMNIHPHHHSRGFTLIELLVVIAIIAVLAAAGFTAGNAAILKARKTVALNTATGLEQAVNNFYSEYGSLPATGSADTTFATNEATGKDLVLVLTGQETGATPLNSKAINYLNVKEGKKVGTGGRDGMIYTSAGVPDGIYDPWAGSFKVRLDLDYDEKLTVQPKGATSSRVLNARRVAVWSDGQDGAASATGKATDDVTTW